MNDAKLLFQWVNDEKVRKSSFSSDQIDWDVHIVWLKQKLSDPGVRIYIGESLDGTPVGQVRFEQTGPRLAEVDIHTDPRERGKGVGQKLVTSGLKEVFNNTDWVKVRATVKKSNSESLKMFQKSGFQFIQEKEVLGCKCEVLEINRDGI